MYLSLKSIFDFTKCTTSLENTVEGEEVLRAKQIILCGKVQEVNIIFVDKLKSNWFKNYIFYYTHNLFLCKMCIIVSCALLTIEEWVFGKDFSYTKFPYSR